MRRRYDEKKDGTNGVGREVRDRDSPCKGGRRVEHPWGEGAKGAGVGWVTSRDGRVGNQTRRKTRGGEQALRRSAGAAAGAALAAALGRAGGEEGMGRFSAGVREIGKRGRGAGAFGLGLGGQQASMDQGGEAGGCCYAVGREAASNAKQACLRAVCVC